MNAVTKVMQDPSDESTTTGGYSALHLAAERNHGAATAALCNAGAAIQAQVSFV